MSRVVYKVWSNGKERTYVTESKNGEWFVFYFHHHFTVKKFDALTRFWLFCVHAN